MASSETPPPSIRQGARIVPPDSDSTVEEVLLAVGHDQLVFASRMNKAVVVFLKDELHVHMLVESGVFIRDIFVQVSPLSAPSTRITVSGVPPFIPNKLLESELRRLASGFRTLSLGCRDVRHVQSLRRQAFMFLDSPTQTLEVSFRVRHGDGHYVVYASSRSMKCFKFGDVGHKRFACPRGGASGPVPRRNLPRALVPRRVPPVGLWFLQLRTMRRRVKQTVTNSPSLLMKIQRDRVRTRTCRCLGLQATLSLQPRLIHNCRNNPPDTSREGQGLSTSQVSGEDMEYDSESDSISTVGATNSYYSLEEVNQFLDETFGRSVRVQEYFEDTDKFIKTVAVLKRKTGFDQLDEKKRFRLKKHITTLRKGKNVKNGLFSWSEKLKLDDTDMDVDEVLQCVCDADSVQQIEQFGSLLVQRLRLAQHRRNDITAQEMKAVMEERDGSVAKEALLRLQRERDSALDHRQRLEAELQALRANHRNDDMKPAVEHQNRVVLSEVPQDLLYPPSNSRGSLSEPPPLLVQLQQLSKEKESVEAELQRCQEAEREAGERVRRNVSCRLPSAPRRIVLSGSRSSSGGYRGQRRTKSVYSGRRRWPVFGSFSSVSAEGKKKRKEKDI
ncbi:hypothetical protein F2P81_003359 [Scophthalmus maximus]|uniref:Uncharacterized protein n=1 Tax=Scophthalmus maximus TaxID=52904 RepID=A0A6A4TN51_SCOMX|nr:hypothetical protein F2P81_003359 [Scophthalmus maximus]